MKRKDKFYVEYGELNSILVYLYGLHTGQEIFEKIVKEQVSNERQSIFAK